MGPEKENLDEPKRERSIEEIRTGFPEDPRHAAESEEPTLNGATIIGYGNYRALYEIEVIDAKKKLWRGKPIPTVQESALARQNSQSQEHHWIYFHRNYDDRNDWDRLYFEHEFEDIKTFGVPFILIPKEKILFAYDEAPKYGISIVRGGKILGGDKTGGIVTL
jgi:hypothetical protein